MKPIFLSSFLLFLIFAFQIWSIGEGSPSNPNGAIHSRFTTNGIDYIGSVIKRSLDRAVNRLTIPDIRGYEQMVRYGIYNSRIENVVPGPYSLQATNRGLRWRMTFSEIRLRANWYFNLNTGWFPISDSGYAHGVVRNLRFDVTITPRANNGKLEVLSASVIPDNCASVSGISIDIGGTFFEWLYDILIDAFRGKIQAEIPKLVCRLAGKEVEHWSKELFPNMRTSDVIDVRQLIKIDGMAPLNLLVDYGLITPIFQNRLMNVRFNGEVYPQPKSFTSFPFSPSSMPYVSTSTSKHVYLVISDFFFNTLLYSVKRTGIVRQTFFMSDIDQDIGNLLAQLCQGHPGASCINLGFTFDVIDRPSMTFSKSKGVTLVLKKVKLVIQRSSGGRTSDLFSIYVDVTISAQVTLSPDGRLFFTFSAPQANLVKVESQNQISPDQERQTRNFVRMAGARYGQMALNRWGAKGIELPDVNCPHVECDIKDRELLVENGALVVGANLVVTF